MWKKNLDRWSSDLHVAHDVRNVIKCTYVITYTVTYHTVIPTHPYGVSRRVGVCGYENAVVQKYSVYMELHRWCIIA